MAESEEIVPSVSAASSNLFLAVSIPLESAASSSNVPVDSSGESESDEEANSESESQWEELSSEDGDANEDADLSEVIEALKSRDEIHNILSNPIPSVTQIVNDVERMSAALHRDIEHHEAPQGRPPSNLIHLMTNITQQLEDYQPESDVGPALHAARQVAYWSSIFISMVSNNAATNPSNLNNPAVFITPSNNQPMSSSLPPSSSQPTAPIPTSALIPSSSSQPTFPFATSASISCTSSQFTFPNPASSFVTSAINQLTPSGHPEAFIPSTISQPTLPMSTSAFVPSTISQPTLPISTSAFVSSTISQPTLPISTSSFVPYTVSQPTLPILTSAFIPSTISQPTLPILTSAFVPSTISQPTLPISTSAFVPYTSSLPTLPILTSAFIPSTISQPTLPISTSAFVPSAISPPTLPISTSAFVPYTSSLPTVPISTSASISSSSNQTTQPMTTTTFIPSGINQPILGTHRTAVISSAVYQPTLSRHPAAFIQPTGNQPPLSIPATTFFPPSRTQSSWSNSTTVSIPPTRNQPVLSTATTDPATIAMFNEYGSGSLAEWLDSLVIPRNIDNLQQVKDLWEICEVASALACLYVDTERFDAAEPLHREVLELDEKFADQRERGWSKVATTLNGLGVLYYKTNKFDEALEYYNRCLELHRRTLPPTHHLIPDTLNNIGALYKSMLRWEDCARVLEEALQAYEEAYFGQLPPDVGGTLLNLGMAYLRIHDASKAEPLYLRALDIRTKAYGPDHHDVGQTLLSYSAFLLSVDAKRSADAAKRAVEIMEKALGPEHINTLNAQENAAIALAKEGKFDEAHPFFKKSGVIRHEKGQMNSSIPILNSVMADYYLNNGHNDEARQLFERLVGTDFATDRDFAALDFLDDELLGENRPERPYEETVDYGLEKFPSSPMIFGRKLPKLAENGDSQRTLEILEKGGFGPEKYNESYQSFVEKNHRQEGLDIIETAHEKFPNDPIILHNLASCLAFYKDYVKACTYFKKLLDLEPGNTEVMGNYGRVLAMAGEVEDSKKILENALHLAEERQEEQLIEQFKSYLNLLNET